MTPYDVVNKIIGPINPVGETTEDNKRYGNLEEMCLLVDKLLCDIHAVARQKSAHATSIKKAGTYADNFLTEVTEQ